jgi:hypothetical protein
VNELGEHEARRRFTVAAWREAPYFDDAERAALALAECFTRLADRPDPVPDEVWDEAARHYDEAQLAALVLWIALANVFNRLNVTIRQPAGSRSWAHVPACSTSACKCRGQRSWRAPCPVPCREGRFHAGADAGSTSAA